MMLLLYLVTLVAFTGLVRASPIATIGETDTEPKKRNTKDCYAKGGAVYHHGQVFNPDKFRCIKYRCMSGSIDYYEEGCDILEKCWPVNGTFRHQCRDYRCEVTDLGEGRRQYTPNPIGEQMCWDIYGQCKRPGETFSYKMKGTVKLNCKCTIDGEKIFYQCFD